METTSVSYDFDGTTMIGHLAVPDGAGPFPAVLVAHEGPGIDAHAKSRAERLAGLGYIAFALDYHGGGERLPDMGAVMAKLGPLRTDPDRTRALGRAGLDVLLAHPQTDTTKVAAIGYCFGGTMALELARPDRRSAQLSASIRVWRQLDQRMPRTSPPRCLFVSAATIR